MAMTKTASGLWGWLARRFSANRDILVVLDRRKGERRRSVTAVAEERRHKDRRRPESSDLGEVTCLLGEGTRFVGELSFRGAFRVDGRLDGPRVSGEVLIVGERAHVNAEIQVEILQIGGQLRGNVTATRWAELLESSHVTGTIRTPRLTIWKGAVFNGTCEMPSATQDDASRTASDGTTTPTPLDSM
jgi:cytoskeletal protein CcmA (bactofilin family)